MLLDFEPCARICTDLFNANIAFREYRSLCIHTKCIVCNTFVPFQHNRELYRDQDPWWMNEWMNVCLCASGIETIPWISAWMTFGRIWIELFFFFFFFVLFPLKFKWFSHAFKHLDEYSFCSHFEGLCMKDGTIESMIGELSHNRLKCLLKTNSTIQNFQLNGRNGGLVNQSVGLPFGTVMSP